VSWEDHPPISYPCPCGKRAYSVTQRSDDWGRFEERWKMLCPECQETHGLYSNTVNRKGMVLE